MKILVRNKQTSEYVKETGVYTAIPVEAVDFLCPELAVEFCERHRLRDHEILATEEEAEVW